MKVRETTPRRNQADRRNFDRRIFSYHSHVPEKRGIDRRQRERRKVEDRRD